MATSLLHSLSPPLRMSHQHLSAFDGDREMWPAVRGLFAKATSDGGYLPLATQAGREWAEEGKRRSARACDFAGPVFVSLVHAAGFVLCGFIVGQAFATRGAPILTVSSSPLFPVDLSGLKTRPYDPLPAGVANSRNLNAQQCDDAFPLLWPAILKTARHFRSAGGITLAQLDELEKDDTRVSVIDGQLYVKTFHGEYTSRSFAVLASLQEALRSSPDVFPDVEFVFRATDNVGTGRCAHFGLTKLDDDDIWLLPDFGFWAWPEPRVLGWQDARRKAIEMDQALNWTAKEDKLFWRGAYLSQLRHDLRDTANAQPWGDIDEIKWGENGAGRISMEEHCKKRFLATADSHSYSGRLKYLMLCRSVVVSHRKRWRQHWHGALDGQSASPTQNWVELPEENWDGLVDVMEGLRKNPARAEEIAENAVRSLRDRYLTPASIACYWRRVLAEYASLQRFRPTRGGIDFESFILERQVDYPPH